MTEQGVVIAAVGVGSNLGDRQRNIDEAMRMLRETAGARSVAPGPVIETAALVWPGTVSGEAVESGPYLNSAALVETTLTPRELLNALNAIERRLGRDRTKETQRWGPRTIDLDLLLYGEAVIDEAGMTVPHPRMHERRFVLDPLCAIGPGMSVPTLGKTVAALLGELIAREYPAKHGDGRDTRAGAMGVLLAASIAMWVGSESSVVHAATAQTRQPAAVHVREAKQQEITPREVLRRMREAYSRMPWAERVRMLVTDERGVTRGSTYMVRYAPAFEKNSDSLFVDLGRVQIFADGVEVLAVTPSAGELAFQRKFDIENKKHVLWAIREVFPPVALPQVAAAGLSDEMLDRAAEEPVDLLSIVGPVSFVSANAEDRGRILVLRGTSQANSKHPVAAVVTMSIIAETGRLRDVLIGYPKEEDAERGVRIELRCSPMSPGDRAAVEGWRPSIEGKRLVDSPSLLTPRVEVFAMGENVARVSMLDTHGRAVSIGAIVNADSDPPITAVIFTRIPLVMNEREAADAPMYPDLNAAWALFDDDTRTGKRPVSRRVVLVSSLEDAASLEKIQSALDAVPTEITEDGGLFWAASPEGTIDRFDADASTVIVLVDRNGILIGSINADALSESDEIRQQVEDELVQRVEDALQKMLMETP